MRERKVTINDISERCGVSIATVSRVINNNGRFSGDTEKRVWQAVHELGYASSSSAKAVRARTNRLVGIFVNDLNYEICAVSVVKLQRVLKNRGFASVVCGLIDEADDAAYCSELIHSLKMCGVVMLLTHKKPFALDDDIKVPVVYIYKNPFSQEAIPENVFILETDDFAAGHLAAAELYERGCRRIADVRFRSVDDRVPLGRHLGFLNALYEKNMSYDENLSIIANNIGFQESLKDICAVLEKNGVADGYFCSSDLLAVCLMRALESMDFHIPRDVKVIGCNDMTIARYNVKPITTLAHDLDEMCASAAEMMEGYLEGVRLTEAERRMKFGVRMIRRATT